MGVGLQQKQANLLLLPYAIIPVAVVAGLLKLVLPGTLAWIN
jgi:hypothetical protein